MNANSCLGNVDQASCNPAGQKPIMLGNPSPPVDGTMERHGRQGGQGWHILRSKLYQRIP